MDRFIFDHLWRASAAPMGIRPDGSWMTSPTDLPDLPLPTLVWVGSHCLVIDGWIFWMPAANKPLFEWLHKTFLGWAQEDGSDCNREWISGVIDALQEMFRNA